MPNAKDEMKCDKHSIGSGDKVMITRTKSGTLSVKTIVLGVHGLHDLNVIDGC